MIIRKAKKEDLPFLWEFEKENRLYDRKILGSKFKIFFLWDINKEEKEQWLKAIEKDFSKKTHKIFVIEENKKLIGYVMGYIHDFKHPKQPQKIGYIEEFFLTKKARGKGFSSKLMERVFNWFKRNKVKYVSLDVFASNKKVIEVYKKFGFEPFSIHMKKKL